MSMTRRYVWESKPGDDLFAIPVPFDPKLVFGRANAPIVVTIGALTYRSTVTNMGGSPWIPFRKNNRAAAAIPGHGPVEVTLTLDQAERTVEVPDDLAAALDAIEGARAAWDAMSFTARREHVEGLMEARRPETRAKRLDKAIEAVTARLK